MNPFVEEIIQKAATAMALSEEAVRILVSVPPDESLGDYAIPCFTLAKERKQNPAAIWASVRLKTKPAPPRPAPASKDTEPRSWPRRPSLGVLPLLPAFASDPDTATPFWPP